MTILDAITKVPSNIINIWMIVAIIELVIIIILGIILLLGVVDMWRRGFRIKLDILDISILLYIFTLIAISFVQGISTRGIIYGLRYDTEFLFVFLFFRRIVSFWGISFREIARVFLISGGLMFALSLAVRYIFGETFLLIF